LIPVGYMAKRVVTGPDWMKAPNVREVYSVSNCVSRDFANYIKYWRHNGYWFFDSPEIIAQLARENALDLDEATFFFYEVHDLQFNQAGQWTTFAPEPSFGTDVVIPAERILEGFDVVTFSCGTSAERSPRSCNGLAANVCQ
jgi:hypothetical protein